MGKKAPSGRKTAAHAARRKLTGVAPPPSPVPALLPGRIHGPIPSPGSAPFIPERPRPATGSLFTSIREYVDKSVPYLRLKRHDVYSMGVDVVGPHGDGGIWSDLKPDQVEMIPIIGSPEIGLWDGSGEDARTFMVEGPATIWDGPVRARLAEIGIARHEWEEIDPGTREVIKDFLRVEMSVQEVVVAATLIRDDVRAREIQRKAKKFLADVTKVLADRLNATNSPITAIRRDRAWHDAQPLLARLRALLSDIEKAAKQRDLVNDHAWVAEQAASVNAVLTSFRDGCYYAYVTVEIMRSLKQKGARKLALEITRYFRQCVSPDVLRRTYPPRQK